MLILNKYETLEAIKDYLNLCKMDFLEDVNGLYHHNRIYNSIPKILDQGILSKRMQYEYAKQPIPKKVLDLAKDDACANGLDYVSVAQAGMTDLYDGEDEYDVFDPHWVDIILPSTIDANRHTVNYGNEFLVKDRIDPSYFQAIDIRLFELIKRYENTERKYGYNEEALLEIIRDYNQLRVIAKKMITNGLYIPLRDMSDNEIDLDKNILSDAPSIILKK